MLCAGPIVCGHASPRRGAGAHGATRACRNCDVAIVGAGPAGLSAAIAIRQALPGVSVEVFEKAARFQPAGSVINLGVNAMKVYRAMDPSGGLYEKLVAAKAPSTFAAVWTLEGHEARRLWLEELDQANVAQYGLTSQRMAWFDFQTALRSHLPDDCVHVDHAFHRFSEDDEGVLVTFNDGSAAVRCKLLIGADGVNSQVRRQLAEGSQQLECTRRVLARAACSLENWHGPKDAFAGIDNFIIYTLGGAAGASLHSLFHGLITFNAVFPPESLEQAGVSVLYDHTDTTVRAHLVTKDGALNSDDEDPEVGKQILLRLLAPFHDKVKGIVQGMPAAKIVLHNDYLCVDPAEAKWSSDRVCLIGDAVHSMGVTGIGIGLAVEDAFLLARRLQDDGLSPGAVASFQKERLPRIHMLYNKLVELRKQGLPTVNSNLLQRPGAPAGAPAGGPGAPPAGNGPAPAPAARSDGAGAPGPAPRDPAAPLQAAPQGQPAGGPGPAASGPGAPQGPPKAGAPGGQGQQFQMFEVWANKFLAEQNWEPLAARARSVAQTVTLS